MGFLRRVLGDRSPAPAPGPTTPGTATPSGRPGSGEADAGGPVEQDEATRERELLRAEAERLADDLIQRQLRYADRSWTPPAQGGPRRADDPAADGEG